MPDITTPTATLRSPSPPLFSSTATVSSFKDGQLKFRKPKPRTLILCFDGTTDQYENINTNVVKLYSLFRKDLVQDQLCYYQPGVGTYFQPGVVSPIFGWAAQILDKAIAWYLYQHVLDGYKFLMQNYNVGDRVCLFGFSRGAYTARALAGMLHKVGLLSKDNFEQIPFAYKLYESQRKSDDLLAEGFKKTFSRHVPIEFVGVWDTVASVGVLVGRTLPFVAANDTIRWFRQALALDEHRAKFRPEFCHGKQPEENPPGKAQRVKDGKEARLENTGTDKGINTDIKEVWFVGCHADVGGGSVPDSEMYSLSNISLRWMIQELVRADCGILFDLDAFARWNIHITSIAEPPPLQSPQTLQEPAENNDLIKLGKNPDTDVCDLKSQVIRDLGQKIEDQLKNIPLWWLLEIFPTTYRFLDHISGKWRTARHSHLGHGRYVPPRPLFHESVRLHMKSGYRPRAHYNADEVSYVS